MTDLDPLESLYFAALERAPADRSAYLDEACRDKPELRERVERLLAAKPQIGEFLQPPAVTVTFASEHEQATVDFPGRDERIGAMLAGKYKLIEAIGEGGMGSVFMAQQTQPVKRNVAVKVIKAGMDSKAVLARFEAERQALAMMDHPNIARVLDAGTTDGGRPFFVMELVKGVPITEYCDAHKLTPRQRLELFVPVCNAIQHAHQKGVIHRDIKPSNVLVALYDDKPVPKVIDFGLAKAAGQILTDKTLMTGFGAVVGTPEYMSPEQASLNNLDIDTRSDVYSLGVLLYELLTGSTPVDRKSLGKAALMEILRIVREVEAPKPSAKLSTIDTLPSVAANRGSEPAKLSKMMRGELDWLVLKALEKDRTRRYASANGFAADIQRYLANEPVLARPASSAYRLQKAWQRNKFAFGAISAIVASLIVGIAFSTWQAMRADGEAKRAETEATRAMAALNELRETAPAFAAQARTLMAKEDFAEAIEKLDYAMKLRPDDVFYPISIGNLLQCQLRLTDAAKVYRGALTLQPDDLRAKANLELCEELLATSRATDGKLSRESLSKLLIAMQREQRSAAELMPVSRLLGEEKKLVVAYWLERLKSLPISAEKPLAQRLSVRDDGLLALDLSGTKITDLSPLTGAPLAELNASGLSELNNIATLRGMKLVDLNLSSTKVADLSPLEKMQSLEKLQLYNTLISDLGPLRGIRLKLLNITACPVRDISPLQFATLEQLYIMDTRVADLTPLAGMPLKFLDMGAVPVTDFTPLIGLPLEVCNFPGCQVTDLSFLRGLPLKELMLWNCHTARNYAVLSEIKTLELLILPNTYQQLPEVEFKAIESLRSHPKLRQLGCEAGIDHTTTRSVETFWKDWEREKTLLAAVREREKTLFAAVRKSGFRYSFVRFNDGTYSLNIEDQPLTDLSILKGIPISRMWLNGCQITDLTPIRELPLQVLWLHRNPIVDLKPLRGMPIVELGLDETNVSDLTPIKDLKLKRLYLHKCQKLTDISPLSGISTLEFLTLPVHAQNVEPLRKMTNLKYLAYGLHQFSPWLPTRSFEEFWKEHEQLGWIRAMHHNNIKPQKFNQLADGTCDLNIDQTSIKDLVFLRGAKISLLSLGDTDVSDLSPLQGMPLTLLHIYRTKVTDLKPLQGMSLKSLNLVGCNVSDLSTLRGMPIESLRLTGCDQLIDISPLKDIKTLKEVTLPPKAKDYEFLRTFPTIERISYREDPKNGYRPDKSTAEFWKSRDNLKSNIAIKPALPRDILTPDEAKKRMGETVAVQFKVLGTGQSRDIRWYYLNTHEEYRDPENFTISIMIENPERLQQLGLPEKHADMLGRTIVARGKIGPVLGRTQIVVSEEDIVWLIEKK